MRLIAYYRVSTRKQAGSGLGLDAQRQAVQQYATGRNADVIAEYVETESGRKSDRPRFAEALAHARRTRATIIIAKLDRLGRSVHFISGLMESGVPFDSPIVRGPIPSACTSKQPSPKRKPARSASEPRKPCRLPNVGVCS